jgi:MFS family permease
MDPAEYELRIDAQAEKFLETKQKLSYFLITASIAPIAFAIQYAGGRLGAVGGWVWMLILGLVAGVLCTAAVLWALYCELKSYQKHIAYRYQSKRWTDLTAAQQTEWDKLNQQARRSLNASLVLLLAEITLLVGFVIRFALTAPWCGLVERGT